MYKQLKDVRNELKELQDKGLQRGYSIGWKFNDLPITFKLGCTTYVAAAPASGKTELIKEIQINLSCIHGLNHVIFTPETGSPTEIFAELCHAYIGKPYLSGKGSMSQQERHRAEKFVDEHFIIVDPVDEDLTITQMYSMVDTIEKDLNKKIHTTLIDPWNELTEEYLPEDLGREDKYLSRMLGNARKNARKTNRHHFIVTHVRDQAMVSQGEIRYYPPPHAREFAGGQVWFRKGLLMLIPWRPPEGLLNDHNEPYKGNELHLKVAKSKPKGVSENGTYILYLDTVKFQYYMLINNQRIYADRSQAVEQKSLKPNLDFSEEREF